MRDIKKQAPAPAVSLIPRGGLPVFSLSHTFRSSMSDVRNFTAACSHYQTIICLLRQQHHDLIAPRHELRHSLRLKRRLLDQRKIVELLTDNADILTVFVI